MQGKQPPSDVASRNIIHSDKILHSLHSQGLAGVHSDPGAGMAAEDQGSIQFSVCGRQIIGEPAGEEGWRDEESGEGVWEKGETEGSRE